MAQHSEEHGEAAENHEAGGELRDVFRDPSAFARVLGEHRHVVVRVLVGGMKGRGEHLRENPADQQSARKPQTGRLRDVFFRIHG